MSSILIKNGEVVTEEGISANDILIEDGTLTKVAPGLSDSADEVIDANNLLVFPGFIDCHVHFREPGMEEAEDMQSGAASARSGGVTTVCDMPNTNPPTNSAAALNDKLKRAAQITDCDIRFFFNVSKHEHLEELANVDQSNICGVKLYFDHSTGNQKADADVVEGVFQFCAENKIPLVGHCEDSQTNEKAKQENSGNDVSLHSLQRPVESEQRAIDHAITLAKKHGTAFHVAHLSTKQGLDLVQQAKADGLPITCEVAPHHLFLSTDDYAALGTLAKMNPPLRSKDHSEALWDGLKNGSVDCVATDHAPHTSTSKQVCHPERSPEGEVEGPLDAPSGVPGVETMIPLLLSKGLGPSDLIRVCHTNPNRIFNLGKAGIALGKPADITLINPKQTWVIHGNELKSKCGWTPYEGWEITGKVERVIR